MGKIGKSGYKGIQEVIKDNNIYGYKIAYNPKINSGHSNKLFRCDKFLNPLDEALKYLKSFYPDYINSYINKIPNTKIEDVKPLKNSIKLNTIKINFNHRWSEMENIVFPFYNGKILVIGKSEKKTICQCSNCDKLYKMRLLKNAESKYHEKCNYCRSLLHDKFEPTLDPDTRIEIFKKKNNIIGKFPIIWKKNKILDIDFFDGNIQVLKECYGCQKHIYLVEQTMTHNKYCKSCDNKNNQKLPKSGFKGIAIYDEKKIILSHISINKKNIYYFYFQKVYKNEQEKNIMLKWVAIYRDYLIYKNNLLFSTNFTRKEIKELIKDFDFNKYPVKIINENLKLFNSAKQKIHTMTATISAFGNPTQKVDYKTIAFENIEYKGKLTFRDHAWCMRPHDLKDIKIGTMVQFDCNIYNYHGKQSLMNIQNIKILNKKGK